MTPSCSWYAPPPPTPEEMVRIAFSSIPESPLRKHGSGTQTAQIVQNVFLDASPVLIELSSTSKLLIWVERDPNDLPYQSTEIAWSYYNGTTWSPMQYIQNDTQIEVSPVACPLSDGKIVAAWLRINDPNYNGNITWPQGVRDFFNKFDVVSSVFDPSTQTWSAVVQVTNDASFDGDLHMACDLLGQPMLTWIKNGCGELDAQPPCVSDIFSTFWLGSMWDAPIPVLTAGDGFYSHTSAKYGSEAVVMYSRDPTPLTPNDHVLEMVVWDSLIPGWSNPTVFSQAGTDNRFPEIMFDGNGTLHVSWLMNGDFVHATMTDPLPKVIRTQSAGLSFTDVTWLTNPAGNLTLVWAESYNNGPAGIHARVYDTSHNVWSEDILLTSQVDTLFRDINGFFSSSGNLALVYVAEQINWTSITETLNGQQWTIENIPLDGPASVEVLDHPLQIDLTIEPNSLQVQPFLPSDGDLINLTVTIRNNGDFATQNFVVRVYLGDPSAGGVSVSETTVTNLLLGGGTLTIPFSFTYTGTTDIYVKVDADDTITEADETNNTVVYTVSNAPPDIILIANPIQGPAPLTVTFDASATTDPDGDPIVSYTWSFGDGTLTASGASVQHTFQSPGEYVVILVVRDVRGGMSLASIRIDVTDPQTMALLQPLSFDLIDTNGNGVFDPGETVSFIPTWQNPTDTNVFVTGNLTSWTGGGGLQYILNDSAGVYGDIPALTSKDCLTFQDCYELMTSGARQPGHVDAMLHELVSTGDQMSWNVHIGGSFNDVLPSMGNYRHVETMLHKGITQGCSGGKYCPKTHVGRGMMAVFIARALLGGEPPQSYTDPNTGRSYDCSDGLENHFVDVDDSKPYCRHVHYIWTRGIVSGCATNLYCPTDKVTRGMMAVYVSVSMLDGNQPPSSYVDPDTGRSYNCTDSNLNHFTDIPDTEPNCAHVHYLWARSVITGCGSSIYCPKDVVTRGQMAVFIVDGFQFKLYAP